MGNQPSNDKSPLQHLPLPEKREKRELTVESLSKAQRRKLQEYSKDDEWYFTAGIMNLLATSMIAVRFPAHYWIWHIVRTLFYLPYRYIRFKKTKSELYLLDWCYFVTYLSTICSILALVRVTLGVTTALFQYNQDFIHAGFAMACGPLAWSIFIFRNSLVFHDVDHSTSVFIHISPFVLFWCLRWGSGIPSTIETNWPAMFHVCNSPSEFEAADICLETWEGMLWCDACKASPRAFLLPPAFLYLFVWSVPYYVVVLVWWRKWCEETGRETLYSFFAGNYPNAKKWCDKHLGPIVGERHAGEVGYMVGHFLSMILFCSTSYLLWHSFLLHTALMVFVLWKAVHNGSTFMFRIFAYRYAAECLEEHRDVIEKID